jgi:two-component system heavy metal sensor histidine kinase CusS
VTRRQASGWLSRFIPRSIFGRLTVWFTAVALLLMLAKTISIYLIVGPDLVAQEKALVTLRARWIAAHLAEKGPLENLPAEAIDLLRGTPGLARVALADGRVIAEVPKMGKELPMNALPPAEGPELVWGRAGRRYWVTTIRPAGTGGAIVQVAVVANEFLILLTSNGRMWLAVLVLLLLSAVAGYRIARHGIRPVEDFVRVTRDIGGMRLHQRVDVELLPGELRPLGATFNDMLDRLQSAFDRISQFSDNIAHELRTPLSVIASQIDVVLGAARSAEEYRDILESSREEIGALAELVHRLLFLSRAEDQSIVLNVETLDISEELAAVQEFYDPLAADSGVALEVAGQAALSAPADRVLIRRALGNLVVNAIRHTPEGGRVILAAECLPDSVRIMVSDSGCGIEADHLPHMFDRFYRVERARESKGGHVGLGLAIAKAIVVLHRGAIEIDSTVGKGTVVAIDLPQRRPQGAA